jgi:hypothetical protein
MTFPDGVPDSGLHGLIPTVARMPAALLHACVHERVADGVMQGEGKVDDDGELRSRLA